MEGDVGHGVGPAALSELVAALCGDPDVPMIGLTTERANTRAHRAFAKAGFRIARQDDAPGLGWCHLMLLDLRVGRAGGRSTPALDDSDASAARGRDDAMATSADAVIRAWFEQLWNQGREDTIDRLLAPGARVDGLAAPIHGPEEFKPFYRTFRAAFPDIRVAVERTITEGDLVAAHCRVTGRRAAHARETPGTAVEFWGMCIARVQDGKITEAWNSFDFLALYQQLGLMPAAPAL